MKLREIEIRNFRSLECVVLGDLHDFNVLIGRNNSGKSSVFSALQLLAESMAGQEIPLVDVITDKDVRRSIQVSVTCELDESERQRFVADMHWPTDAEREEILQGSHLAQNVAFTFSTTPEPPTFFSLHETRIVAEDGAWATIQNIVVPQGTVPQSIATDLRQINRARRLLEGTEPGQRPRLVAHLINPEPGTMPNVSLGQARDPLGAVIPLDNGVAMLLRLLENYLKRAFFFSPFRYSDRHADVQSSSGLSPSGDNLVSVLSTILNANRRKIAEIEAFLHNALPDIGTLQTPFVPIEGSSPHRNQTEIRFLSDGGLTCPPNLGPS